MQDVKYTTVEGVSIATTGLTNAVFVGTNPCEVRKWIAYGGGGTALLVSALSGSTMAGASLAAAAGYPLPSGVMVDLHGAASFYIAAGGVATSIFVIRGYNGLPYSA